MAEFKAKYADPVAVTITLASLATSATRVVGRESDVIDNGTTRYIDAHLTGKITTGTSPTNATFIDIWAYTARNPDTPTYPDVLDGTDSGETFTDENSRNSAMTLIHTITVDGSSDQVYDFTVKGLAAYFGGVLPQRIGFFVAHNTGVNLNATGSNHEILFEGITGESV